VSWAEHGNVPRSRASRDGRTLPLRAQKGSRRHVPGRIAKLDPLSPLLRQHQATLVNAMKFVSYKDKIKAAFVANPGVKLHLSELMEITNLVSGEGVLDACYNLTQSGFLVVDQSYPIIWRMQK
jgi:hypothetical protein